MDQKEIYGAIEFIDHEVRFVLGEFHNNQLNILKTESLYTDAINRFEIVDVDLLVSNVKKVINTASEKMGFKISKVLVLIPSFATNRYSKRIKIVNENDNAFFSEANIVKTINNSLSIDYNSSEILINQVINRYIVDGVSSQKLDLSKKISRLYVDIDIYTGPKDLIFDYLSIVEKAGLEVLNIYLDSYALALEMALLQHSRNKNIVMLKYERENTTMSLLNKGRIINSVMIDMGYSALVETIREMNNISSKNAEKLILTNSYLSIADNQKAPVFLYSEGSETKSIDDNYLHNLLLPILLEQMEEISEMIKPILTGEDCEVYITGKGASIVALSEVCQSIFNCKTKVYTPEILGARKGSLVACLGAIYAYKDTSILDLNKSSSLDDSEFGIQIKPNGKFKEIDRDESEDSMANRLKELFRINKD